MLKTKSYLLALTVVFAFAGCSNSNNLISSKASCAEYRHVQYKKKQVKNPKAKHILKSSHKRQRKHF